MFKIAKFILSILFLTFTCSFRSPVVPIVEQGNVIYPFASGRMQCQSEVDSTGHIFVLLKSLDKNTKIRFSDVIPVKEAKNKKVEFVVKAVMEVEEDTNLCASWKNFQEVSIKINPLPTQTVSLKGKEVYASNSITVMTL